MYKLSVQEKEDIKIFCAARIPDIYKEDATDNILFVEDVCFDVCKSLLKGTIIRSCDYHEMMRRYNVYLRQVQIDNFNNTEKEYHQKLVRIMSYFQKVFTSQNKK